jgi:hypothetical protein
MVKFTAGSTAAEALFDLSTNLRDTERNAALVKECQKKGVTWEGIYNGSVGLGGTAPFP